ncbi:MAG: prolipoprotein diacylglyceryl transferase [Ignavibacteria bacterium]|nr:prolipoprotein diacylglyceryl transferase [Ignavibacteria bacterium]
MIDWNIDPTLFTLGPLSPRYYGLLFAGAFLASYYFMRIMCNDAKKSQQDLDSLTITIIVSTIVGARLGHVLFYEPQIITQDFMEVFAVWHGGLASHGGAIGIITGLWIYHKRKKGYSMTWLLDRLAIVAAVSGLLIRVGNFFNSEILGMPTTMPWGVWFKRVDILPIYRHPAQLYEAVLCLVVFVLLWRLYKGGLAFRKPGMLIGLFMVLIFIGRFVIEFVKERQVGFEAGLLFDMGQLLSIPFVLAGAYYIWKASKTQVSSTV